jgi:hypothetical protein
MKPHERWTPIEEDSGRRSFCDSALTPVFEINRFLLDVLIDAACRPPMDAHRGLVLALNVPLARLTPAAVDRLARCPVCFVDGGFRDDAQWTAIASRPGGEFPARISAFPRLQALQLAHQTLTLAWTATRASLESACIIFGMTRKCADIVSHLGIQTIHRIAEQHPDWVRPTWENEPEIWHHLIAMAMQEPPPRLPPIGLRALQRQFVDLEPATCASGEIRRTRR